MMEINKEKEKEEDIVNCQYYEKGNSFCGFPKGKMIEFTEKELEMTQDWYKFARKMGVFSAFSKEAYKLFKKVGGV